LSNSCNPKILFWLFHLNVRIIPYNKRSCFLAPASLFVICNDSIFCHDTLKFIISHLMQKMVSVWSQYLGFHYSVFFVDLWHLLFTVLVLRYPNRGLSWFFLSCKANARV
jgi:hypothetical protein